MASRDLHSNVTTKVAVNTTAISGAGTTAGAIIDTNGYESLEFVVQAGTLTSGGSFTTSLTHGDASNLSGGTTVAASDLLGSAPSFTKADDNTAKRVGYKGHKRYVRMSIVAANETAASGTATLAADLAVGEKVTIESHDFVCKAKYASNIVTCASVAAADKITIAGHDFVAIANGGTPTGDQWAVGAGGSANADSATALANAINASETEGIAGVVTAEASTDTVIITAVEAGDAGNDITLTSSTGVRLAITTAGGKLAGAYDPAADEWPLESTLALSAAALANAINTSETDGITGVVTAAAAEAVVTVTAVAVGTAGNALTFAKTGTHITVSGTGTLSGGVNAVGTIGAVAVLGHPWVAPVA